MNNNPLISIIVRTKDRPKLLLRALKSIASQTYRPIEAVLVNDGGCDLDIGEIRQTLGDVSVNYVRLEQNAGRAHAGNVGIENAKGEYIGFLDDDDEFYPEHVETLVSFLKHSDYKVAYTGVEMVFSNSEHDSSLNDANVVFSKDFSYPDILIVNYIPFNSLLFCRDVIGAEIRLDESLELYEDWDFLIRIGRKYPFWHIKKITARYNQWDKDMQVNRRDEKEIRNMHMKIMDIHREKITNDFILEVFNERNRLKLENIEMGGIMNRVKTVLVEFMSHDLLKPEVENDKDFLLTKIHDILHDKEDLIHKNQIEIAKLQRKITEMQQVIHDKEAHILMIQNNLMRMRDAIGWVLLEKIRLFRDKLLPSNSIRRKVYDVFVKSIKIIIREGLRSFYFRVGDRLKSYIKECSYLSKKAVLILKRYGVKNFIRYGYQYLISGNVFLKATDIYKQWIEKNEQYDELEIKKKIEAFKYKPKISVITPVYNIDPKWLNKCIESVINQFYYNWELCLHDDGSTNKNTLQCLKAWDGKDDRIKISFGERNSGISVASNEALSMATGDYVALLDHDDALAHFALFEVVKALNEDPEIDFIYSDRDIITTEGKRLHPFFKPDWSPDYLLSQNYICHLNVVRKSLIDSLGGFREGYDGSQDYDLALRVTEATDRIFHIPIILYHWRIVEGSAAIDPEAKPYAYDAAIKALNDAFERRRWKGKVIEGASKGYYNPVFHINKHEKVSIVIASEFKEGDRALKKCLDSIRNMTSYDNYEIIIIKSGAADADELARFQHMDNIKILRYDGHFNFHEMSNYAVSASEAEHIVFLGEDTEIVSHEWLQYMLGLSQRKETGIVGAKLLYLDGYVQAAGLIINKNGKAILSHHRHPRDSSGYNGRIAYINNVSAVADVCMMVRRDVFEAVSGFDPSLSVLAAIDLCFKIRQRGLFVTYEPRAEIVCHSDLFLRYENVDKETCGYKMFIEKWGGVIAKGDPYYNPNLDSENCDFSINPNVA